MIRINKHPLPILLDLMKLRIILPVALSALAGYVLIAATLNATALFVTLGTFFMAGASSVINQIQEQQIDRIMPRTQNRPIPSGAVTTRQAWSIAILLFIAGSATLLSKTTPIAYALALLSGLWYNLIYTPLKKKTAFAVIPGSITGALPPMIGYAAASGSLLNSEIILVACFFFLGQIPHFWLIILKYGDEYTLAGLPNLTHFFHKQQIKRLNIFWIVTALSSVLLMISYGLFQTSIIRLLMVICCLGLLSSQLGSLVNSRYINTKRDFMSLNMLYLLVMLAIISDRLIYSN